MREKLLDSRLRGSDSIFDFFTSSSIYGLLLKMDGTINRSGISFMQGYQV